MTFLKLIVEADGGSRGNPGPSGSGAVVFDAKTGEVLVEVSVFGGVATNNVAEYKGVLSGLIEAFKLNPNAEVLVRMDSKLVVEQMLGNWKIKHPDMKVLAIEVQRLVAGKNVKWQWIPREENSRADALANEAMDAEADSVRHLTDVEFISGKKLEVNPSLPSSVRAPGDVTKKLTTLILVRHGRTALTESHQISGGSGDDPHLSELGRADAASVATLISQIGITGPFSHIPKPTKILASPMNRTQDTASIIADRLNLKVDTQELLREIDFGLWDGHTNDEVASEWPEEFQAWRGSWELSPPEGESLREFDERIRLAQKSILETSEGESVVVVAHVMPIRGFLSLSLCADQSGYWKPQVAPCSVTIIRHWGENHSELVTANFTAHL
jgi:probable phosphoglycerate mutase